MFPEEQSKRLRSLAALARAVARSAPLLEVLESATEQTRTAIDAASVSVSRLEPGGQDVRTLINVGELGPTEERWPQNEIYPLEEFPNLLRMAGEHLPWIIHADDPEADPAERRLLRELGKGSAVGALMTVDGQVWGEFYATRFADDEPYGPDDMAYLEALAAIVAGAVSRAEREHTLQELAYHDPLTGLLNRRALDERAAAWFTASADVHLPVTAVMVDINGLKQVNDAAGHLTGDLLLQSVAAALVQHFSPFPDALVARVGGDEFAVLVSGVQAEEVVEAADDLCAASWTMGATANVSCGAATAVVSSDSDVTLGSLFAAADRAQYVAKRGHLRRTVVDEDVADVAEVLESTGE